MQKTVTRQMETIAHFCDYCGKQITQTNQRGTILIKCSTRKDVMCAYDGIGNTDDLCAPCAERLYKELQHTLKTFRRINKKDNI